MTKGWGRSFDDPIEVRGRKLVTLRDVGEYIAERGRFIATYIRRSATTSRRKKEPPTTIPSNSSIS
jgi:hypothetical protein